MISDNQTNIVNFSAKLQEPRFADFCMNLISILIKHKIEHRFMDNTNDIWCRDFMPVQVSENRFIEYVYAPDYLKTKKYGPTRSDPSLVCKSNGIKTIKTDIILDGGNLIRYGSKVIMTEKIFMENKHYTVHALVDKLKVLFETNDIIIIPWDKDYENVYGHADGLVRFIDETRVIIDSWHGSKVSGRAGEDFRNILSSNGLTIETLQFDVTKEDDRNWGYLNFLQLKDLLLIPTFCIEEDEQAVVQLHHLFPCYSAKGQIETIDSRSIIEEEGVLNCISWNILVQG